MASPVKYYQAFGYNAQDELESQLARMRNKNKKNGSEDTNDKEWMYQQQLMDMSNQIAELSRQYGEQSAAVKAGQEELEKQKKAYDAQFATQKSDSEKQLTELKNQNNSALASQKSEYDQKLLDLQGKSNTDLASQKADYEKQLAELTENLNNLRQTSDSQIAELNRANANQKAEYDRQLSGLNNSLSQKESTIAALEQAQQDYEAEKAALWDSMEYAYGRQVDKSNEAYDKERATANTEMLKRGMQRSSYGAQVAANIGQRKLEAANDIRSQQSADYNSRLIDLKNNIQNRGLQREQLAEQQRQFNISTGENARQFDVSTGENARQFDTSHGENVRQYDTSLAEQKRQFNEGQAEGKRQYDTSLLEQQRQFNEGQAENRRQYDTTFAEGQRQYNENLSENKRQYDTTFEENKRQYDTTFGENQRQFDASLAENARQADASIAQQQASLAEQVRANQAGEALAQAQLAETIRANQANEALTQQELTYRYDTGLNGTSGGGGTYKPQTTQTPDTSDPNDNKTLWDILGGKVGGTTISGVGNSLTVPSTTMNSGQYYNNKEQKKNNK